MSSLQSFRNILSQQYFKPSPEWLSSLQSNSNSSITLDYVHSTFLSTSLADSSLPALAPDACSLHNINIGPLVLEIVDIIDISNSAQTLLEVISPSGVPIRRRHYYVQSDPSIKTTPVFPRGTLRFELSDGFQTLVALEHKPVEQLSLTTPLGCKLLLTNCFVRHGVCLLTQQCVRVLGGDVKEMYGGDLMYEFANRLRIRLGITVKEDNDNDDHAPESAISIVPQPTQPVICIEDDLTDGSLLDVDDMSLLEQLDSECLGRNPTTIVNEQPECVTVSKVDCTGLQNSNRNCSSILGKRPSSLHDDDSSHLKKSNSRSDSFAQESAMEVNFASTRPLQQSYNRSSTLHDEDILAPESPDPTSPLFESDNKPSSISVTPARKLRLRDLDISIPVEKMLVDHDDEFNVKDEKEVITLVDDEDYENDEEISFDLGTSIPMAIDNEVQMTVSELNGILKDPWSNDALARWKGKRIYVEAIVKKLGKFAINKSVGFTLIIFLSDPESDGEELFDVMLRSEDIARVLKMTPDEFRYISKDQTKVAKHIEVLQRLFVRMKARFELDVTGFLEEDISESEANVKLKTKKIEVIAYSTY